MLNCTVIYVRLITILCVNLQIFGTPRNHPKSQPFVDHVLSFSVADNRIWFRNYQILEENAELAEIGKYQQECIPVGCVLPAH